MAELINDQLGIWHDTRAILLKILRKTGVYNIPPDDMELFSDFDEYPVCEMCGTTKNNELFKAIDGSRIVECEHCGLWFTSPRIEEKKWINWLTNMDTERNKILTENRIRYGVAMPQNIKLSYSGWFRRYKKKYLQILDVLRQHRDKPIVRVHDVGCGVGFFLITCKEKGLDVTGNDMNGYAVKIMRERFNLNVFKQVLSEIPLGTESLDAINMDAYIEHTYHPLDDLRSAYNLLKKGGVIYVSTFHTDSAIYDRLGNKWDMFAWNHVYHFSSKTLENMIKKAGFQIEVNNMKYDIPVSYIIGKKT